MSNKGLIIVIAVLLVVLGGRLIAARDHQPPSSEPQAAAGGKEQAKFGEKADSDAIRKSSGDFAQAYAKADAKGIAALWTERGEYFDDHGTVLRGRPAIETAFAQFFKDKPDRKVDVSIESIRFPARDLAIEEGLLRQVNPGADLPSSTLYTVVHVREDGKWRIAVAREWGSTHRLEDLDWLLGRWQAGFKDQEVLLSFEKDKQQPFVLGQFTKKDKGKVVSTGTLKIGFDPQRGQLRSWHFDDDGGHGQALWVRDGNRWVLDSVGVLGNGATSASVNLITRLSPNEILWRSIDRVVANAPLPDTLPVKLTRAGENK